MIVDVLLMGRYIIFVLPSRQVLRALQGRLGQQARPGLLAQRGRPDRRVQEEEWEQTVMMALRERQGRPGQRDQWD